MSSTPPRRSGRTVSPRQESGLSAKAISARRSAGTKSALDTRSHRTARQRQTTEIGVRLDFHHFHADAGLRDVRRASTDTWASKCRARMRPGVRSKDENRVRPQSLRVLPLPSRFSPPFIPVSIGWARLGHPSIAAFPACRASEKFLENQKKAPLESAFFFRIEFAYQSPAAATGCSAVICFGVIPNRFASH